MWYHEASDALANGKKVGRLSWPKGDHLKSLKEDTNVSKTDFSEAGLKQKSISVAAGTFAYCSGTSAAIGYVPTAEDKNSQDWAEVEK